MIKLNEIKKTNIEQLEILLNKSIEAVYFYFENQEFGSLYRYKLKFYKDDPLYIIKNKGCFFRIIPEKISNIIDARNNSNNGGIMYFKFDFFKIGVYYYDDVKNNPFGDIHD